jgi:hypothetical protein
MGKERMLERSRETFTLRKRYRSCSSTRTDEVDDNNFDAIRLC